MSLPDVRVRVPVELQKNLKKILIKSIMANIIITNVPELKDITGWIKQQKREEKAKIKEENKWRRKYMKK